jgi:hypothetical protein
MYAKSCVRTVVAALGCWLILSGGAVAQTPVGSGFSYQGQLKDAGAPVNELADFKFGLWDAAAGGTQIGSTLSLAGVDVWNGLFTVWLDFGTSAFAGDARWLEIEVRVPSGIGSYTLLSPRQEVGAVPYALYALDAPAPANADSVDGFHAGATPTASTLLALDASSKYPNSVLRTGAGNGLDADLLDGQHASFFRDASNLDAGTLPSARLAGAYSNALTLSNPTNVFVGDGAALTSLNAGNLSTGTVADARLSANVALLAGVQTFSGAKTFSAAPGFTAAGAPFTVTGSTVVTNLNADLLDGQSGAFYQNAGNLNAGTLPDARLSGNVATLNTAQTFSAVKTFSAAPGFTAATPFSVSSAGLVGNLNADLLDGQQGSYYQNASNITAGTLADARLSSNVALLSGSQTFSGSKTFSAGPSFTAGTPFSVSSSTKVTNLNADLLDGLDSTAFLQAVPNPLALSGSQGGNSGNHAAIIKGTNTATLYADGVAGYVTAAASLINGVAGYSTATSNVGRGVYGESKSSSGIGVLGVISSTSSGGENCGVWGDTVSPTGYGVRATGGARGLYAEAADAGSSAVYARNDSTTGYAVYAWANAGSGTNYGVYSMVDSASAYLFYGVGQADGGDVDFYVDADGDVRADGTFASPAADFAELLPSDGVDADLEPGDVVALSPEAGKVQRAGRPNDPLVVGVYSTKPAFLGGAPESEEVAEANPPLPVALVGRVPVKVTTENGVIRIGDLLTSSSTPGHAMRARPIGELGGRPVYEQGTLLGKAMENFDGDTGRIQLLVLPR